VEVDVIQINGEVEEVVVILMDGVVVVDFLLGEVMVIGDEMKIGKDPINKNVGDVMIILNGMNNRNHGNVEQ